MLKCLRNIKAELSNELSFQVEPGTRALGPTLDVCLISGGVFFYSYIELDSRHLLIWLYKAMGGWTDGPSCSNMERRP